VLCVRHPGPDAPGSRASVWVDNRTSLMWTANASNDDMIWDSAKNYCTNITVGGYSQWRLPTIDELQGLYDENLPNHMRGQFRVSFPFVWSANAGADAAWAFYFRDGKRHYNRGYSTNRALCVRRALETEGPVKGKQSQGISNPRSSSADAETLFHRPRPTPRG